MAAPGAALNKRSLMSAINDYQVQVHNEVQNQSRTGRSFRDAVQALEEISRRSVSLISKPLPEFQIDARAYHIPRYLFLGPKGGAEPIRVGFFAGTYGDEPEGTVALREFVERLELAPILGKDFCLFLYPILNP